MDETTAEIIIKNQERYGTDKGVLTKIKFIKNKQKIEELYNEGLSLRVIWLVMKEQHGFTIGYSQFVKLFRKHIRSAFEPTECNKTESVTTVGAGKNQNKVFDFSPTPNKDDLI
ncbi:MAG: Clr5 domain-containing protein [Ruminobacter sp.]|uniref:Clr5 domain-containing protein n=1 Tax=Ruminobacter sp. TaxID=2774296 RepID=UPI00257F056C|nr:Clr5 domain-containing protein [Ruminobacter sp.]MBQ3775159.1 Clr5 domain-containing protein [Ruminobacter sp.]